MTDSYPPSTSVAEMLADGIEDIEATCGYCGHAWRAPIGFLPDQTPLAKISQLLACPRCYRADIDVELGFPHTPVIH